MAFNIANFWEADRRTARAGETMGQGNVVIVSDWGDGQRKLLKLTTGASPVAGAYGVVYKVAAETYQVESSTAASFTGSRITTIASGDYVVEVRPRAILEYSADLLDASLATPQPVGTALGVLSGKWCTTATGSAVTSPVMGRVFRNFGTRTLIELL